MAKLKKVPSPAPPRAPKTRGQLADMDRMAMSEVMQSTGRVKSTKMGAPAINTSKPANPKVRTAEIGRLRTAAGPALFKKPQAPKAPKPARLPKVRRK